MVLQKTIKTRIAARLLDCLKCDHTIRCQRGLLTPSGPCCRVTWGTRECKKQGMAGTEAARGTETERNREKCVFRISKTLGASPGNPSAGWQCLLFSGHALRISLEERVHHPLHATVESGQEVLQLLVMPRPSLGVLRRRELLCKDQFCSPLPWHPRARVNLRSPEG